MRRTAAAYFLLVFAAVNLFSQQDDVPGHSVSRCPDETLLFRDLHSPHTLFRFREPGA